MLAFRGVCTAFSLMLLPASADSDLKPLGPVLTLNNGVEMPSMAFAAEDWNDVDLCRNATAAALQAGFRFIWSSMDVGHECQAAQAEAISASGIPRSELFIAVTAGAPSRGSCAGADPCYTLTKRLAERQFDIFGMDNIDMIMLDRPSNDFCEGIVGQWQALEDLYHANRTRSIALGNFKASQLECITGNESSITPTVNMMRYYIGHGDDTFIADDARLGILTQAYSPLNTGQLVGNALCESIGAKHGKSGVQVALKWILQHGVAVATQSTSLEHLKADLDIFDFELTAEDMAQLDAVQPPGVLHV